MDNKKFALLDEDALEGVSGGTDKGYGNCTDYVCYVCRYKQTSSFERCHECTDGSAMSHTCFNCRNFAGCSRAVDNRF